jgi:hypothetical protein
MERSKFPMRGTLIVAAIVITIALLAAAATAGSATTTAQPKAGTAFVSINPEAGFPLDPFLMTLQGGGPVDATTMAKECKGYVTKNPTVSVDYKGKADMLKVFFYSDGDPILIVQTPDGKVLCNDNTNAVLLDPTVTLVKPGQGRYDIWVGSALARDLIPGFLVFTGHGDVHAGKLALQELVRRPALVEVLPQRDRLANAAALVKEALAAVKSADKLTPESKPLTAQVTAEGNLPTPELATGDTFCGGLISVAPNYAFEWAGQAKAAGVMFEGDGDATLIVRTPDGRFVCADDSAGSANVNPLVILGNPAAGRYLVWVGRTSPDKPVTGKLTVASTANLKPAVLKQKQ